MKNICQILLLFGTLSALPALAQLDDLPSTLPTNFLGSSNASSLGLKPDLFSFVPIVAGLDQPLTYLESLSTLGVSALGTPEILVGTFSDLGLPLLLEYAPVLDTISTDPVHLLDYVLTGGTILNPAFDFLPIEIPLLTSPLSN